MDDKQKQALIQLSLKSSEMAVTAALAAQTQVFGSLAKALMQKGLLSGDEIAAMFTHAADGLSFGVKNDPSKADVMNAPLKAFVEDLLDLAERVRSEGDQWMN
jgi:hypothetical protein